MAKILNDSKDDWTEAARHGLVKGPWQPPQFVKAAAPGQRRRLSGGTY